MVQPPTRILPKSPPELRVEEEGALDFSRLKPRAVGSAVRLRSLRGCFPKKKQQSEKIRSRKHFENMFYVRMWGFLCISICGILMFEYLYIIYNYDENHGL